MKLRYDHGNGRDSVDYEYEDFIRGIGNDPAALAAELESLRRNKMSTISQYMSDPWTNGTITLTPDQVSDLTCAYNDEIKRINYRASVVLQITDCSAQK
jgi:hypothetical protein